MVGAQDIHYFKKYKRKHTKACFGITKEKTELKHQLLVHVYKSKLTTTIVFPKENRKHFLFVSIML